MQAGKRIPPNSDQEDLPSYMVDARPLLQALRLMKQGDFSLRLPMDSIGAAGELAVAFNEIAELNCQLVNELKRIGKVVGREGKISQRASLGNVAGSWSDSIDSINVLVGDLVRPTAEIARVIDAVARGDLSQNMGLEIDGSPLKGEFLRTARTINTMVDQLGSFASEVTRVARQVGSEGKLGVQAQVQGVSGTWKDLTESVNSMASNLTAQVRNIATVTTAVANGDLSKKITVDVKGEILELKNTINTMVDQLGSFADEVTRVAKEVGTEGKLGGQAQVKGVSGTWKSLTDNVNSMAGNLTAQVRNIAEVTTAVAKGDLSRKITVDVRGEILELKNTINTMVDQLSSFAAEVTRVAREVGSEGKLGGQADVKGVSGTWKDLTDSVNYMASNLTAQVRNIAEVTTAVANGDLSKKITVDVKGEILELKNTINTMVDQLSTFAAQVTTVAREVGVEGQLGGQACVPGAAGTWKDLTDNVNQLAANLTTQIRAIAEVATAITKGDLTRSISVEAEGEVAGLKDLINEMIRNLKDTTQKNTEQNWLKTNLARFTSLLQGQRDLLTVSHLILSELNPLVKAEHGAFYISQLDEQGEPVLRLTGSYAYQPSKDLPDQFRIGNGLVGQCAMSGHRITIENIPTDYVKIGSALGEAIPRNIVVLPILFEGRTRAVIELASLHEFSETHLAFLDQLTESIGIVINTIEANMRTENLLKQSQSLAQELQSQQNELTATNHELEEKARLLAHQNAEVEMKNREIDQARLSLEDKAHQLALTSKYKSEFLANMSHELRTPLNSLLILSKLLAENEEGNLSNKQIDFAQTIYSAGSELLSLINDILDLSKVESGKVSVETGEVLLADLSEDLERSFRPFAEDKNLEFTVNIDPSCRPSIYTDAKRLQQVLRNVLSNAFKFTEKGSVTVNVSPVKAGWTQGIGTLGDADNVIAFSVVDTGIGIAAEKQKIIFEAFQQADGTTSRKYGGTGLGLAICREIATALGGEVTVESSLDCGSNFTFYLPQSYIEPTAGSSQIHLVAQSGSVRQTKSGLSALQESSIRNQRLLKSPTLAMAAGSLAQARPEVDLSSVEEVLLANQEDDDLFKRILADRKVLIIDNDLRDIFAITSILERYKVTVLYAEIGLNGVNLLRKHQDIDCVLVDVSLNHSDGYETMLLIRKISELKNLPIIALTSKTIKVDREKCLRAGASNFLLKPVNQEKLIFAVAMALRN